MKRFTLALTLMLALLAGSTTARAQYYQIANQIPSLLQPALSGSFNYKGYVELSGLAGVGFNRANFAGISTTQGFQYASWFYMGVGIGVDVVRSSINGRDYGYDDQVTRSFTQTKAMIPVFSDFRFNIGGMSSPSMFIDLKLGASWLIGDSYLQMNSGCLTTATQFYFRPSIGVRIPIGSENSAQAFNIGVTYQFLTNNSNYYYRYDDSVNVNSVGVTLGFDW